MTLSTIKHPKISYSQGQRNVAKARILFIVWLLASTSPEGALAAPKRQTTTLSTLGDPLLFNSEVTSWARCHYAPDPPDPPDSPHSPRLCRSANTSSIGAALQRLSRPIRTLMSCFGRPRLQEIPDTPSGPVAEGCDEPREVGSSSRFPTRWYSSNASAASSTVIINILQKFMQQQDVSDIKRLVADLNAAPSKVQCPWLSVAIQWFATQPIKTLDPVAIRDYAALAHIRVTRENQYLLVDYFHSFCNKARDGSFEEKPLIQALTYALAHIDTAVFVDGNLRMLVTLACALLSKLAPSKRQSQQANYLSVPPTLEALFHTLLLIQKVAPGYIKADNRGLYQHCKNYLQKIIDRAQYYPVRYQACILMQTLRLLEAPDPNPQENLERLQGLLEAPEPNPQEHLERLQGLLGASEPSQQEHLERVQGLLGAANLVGVGQGLASLDLTPAELQKGIHLLQKAFAGQRIQPKAWYIQLLSLEERMLQCFQHQELAPYPEPAALKEQAQSLCEQGLNLSILGQLGHQRIQHDRKTFCFGIAMQLTTLALYGPTLEVRTRSIERLIALAQPASWGADTNVMAGLLDGLALVAAQRQTTRATEAAMARDVLEKLAAQPPSDASGQPRGIGRLFHRPQSPQDAASKAFSTWLAGEALPSKLQALQKQTTEQAPSDKKRFVTHFKQTLQRNATIESFRAQEIANLSHTTFANVSYFVDRIAIARQLSAILAKEGVCVLHGPAGAGKSALAVQYGCDQKDQRFHCIDAESSRQLQKSYKELAQNLQADLQPLAKKRTNTRQYRQELARLVYEVLDQSNQTTLLILDNAVHASLIEDYLLRRPATIQVVITTRSAKAFEGKYQQLQLIPFSQDEGLLSTVAAYLEKLTKEGQQLMQYAAYLCGDFIPPSLLSALLDTEELELVLDEVIHPSLVQVVSNTKDQKLGLQVGPDVQAVCRKYKNWRDEAVLGTQEAILSQLAEVLEAQMRGVSSGLARRWPHVELYAPHVVEVLKHSEAAPSAVAARLSGYMGQYYTQEEDYRKAVIYHQKAWKIQKQVHKEAPNHPDIAATLSYLGNIWCLLGEIRKAALLLYLQQMRKAASYHQHALEIREQAYKEAPNHPDIAATLHNLGAVLCTLGDTKKGFGCLKRALAIYEQVYKGVPHCSDMADTLNNLGNACYALGQMNEATSYYERSFEMYPPDHPNRAIAAKNLERTLQTHRAPHDLFG